VSGWRDGDYLRAVLYWGWKPYSTYIEASATSETRALPQDSGFTHDPNPPPRLRRAEVTPGGPSIVATGQGRRNAAILAENADVTDIDIADEGFDGA